MQLDTHIIKLIKNYFLHKPVNKAYLFGSYATGKANINSDIDIMVDLDYQNGIGLEFIKMNIDLNEALDVKVELVTTQSISKYMAPKIESEKILIYER
ncbi:MAG: nucleotidyltransferase domain-containing protein [Bacteroidota bacterium]